MKWLQHSGHRPAQKFTTLHLLKTLPDCKVYKGYKVSTTIHLSTPTTDSKRWVLPPAFQTCCFSTDKNPLPFLFVFQTQSIMQYCQQCSLCRCHIRPEAAFLTVDWRRAINAGLSLVDVSHTLPPCHICHQHLYNYCSSDYCEYHSSASYLCEIRILWQASRLADVWKCLNWLNSLLIVFRQ